MRELPIRLEPGVDLRRELERIARERFPEGAFVVCGLGSLSHPRLRFAAQHDETVLEGAYELLTLSGTVTRDGAHLHASVASETGRVVGGHVAYGNEVRTTVEALLVRLDGWSLSRAFDAGTGFMELQIAPTSGDDPAAPERPAAD